LKGAIKLRHHFPFFFLQRKGVSLVSHSIFYSGGTLTFLSSNVLCGSFLSDMQASLVFFLFAGSFDLLIFFFPCVVVQSVSTFEMATSRLMESSSLYPTSIRGFLSRFLPHVQSVYLCLCVCTCPKRAIERQQSANLICCPRQVPASSPFRLFPLVCCCPLNLKQH
jgi:hypothetical protein